MIRNIKNRDFSKLGLGLFVHYGLYSIIGNGEWIKEEDGMSDEEYDKLTLKFKPKKDFAEDICKFAKKNCFKYIVFTARHHDGFSLYDTRGLSEYDSYNTMGRDLVKELVNSCRKYNIKVFLYHTLIDWHEEKKYNDFSNYLNYLYKSIDILCTYYGDIDGFWFDGMWKYPNIDWNEENIYKIISKKQPNAVIVNNSGLNNIGKRISKYTDVVTCEQNSIKKYNYEKNIDDYAFEMCQTLNDHWGYSKDDINYKSINEIIYNFCMCRKYGGNYLLNIGPISNGEIRNIERELINLFGDWIKINSEAIFDTEPYDMVLPNNTFALRKAKVIYIFVFNVPTKFNKNSENIKIDLKTLNIENAFWLDNMEKIYIDEDNSFLVNPFEYGVSLCVRIAKCVVENGEIGECENNK